MYGGTRSQKIAATETAASFRSVWQGEPSESPAVPKANFFETTASTSD
jgi:hypothetical protein